MDARSILPLSFRNIPLDKLEDHVVAFCNFHRVHRSSSTEPVSAAAWSIIFDAGATSWPMCSSARGPTR